MRRDVTVRNWEWRHRHLPAQLTHTKPTAAAAPIGTRHTETRHVTNVGRTASRVSQTSRRRRDREWRHRQWRHRSHRKCHRTRAYISHRRNHAAHGNEALDERLPYRIPRQPNIPSAERSGVEASVMEASPTQECQRTRSYLSHESNHPSTAIPEQQRSLAWRHSTRATCRSRTEVELGLEAPRCLQYQIYRVCRCRRPRSTRRRIDTSRCMEAWVGSRCSNSRGYAYQDMHVHQLHVEVITLSQFHICMSHV